MQTGGTYRHRCVQQPCLSDHCSGRAAESMFGSLRQRKRWPSWTNAVWCQAHRISVECGVSSGCLPRPIQCSRCARDSPEHRGQASAAYGRFFRLASPTVPRLCTADQARCCSAHLDSRPWRALCCAWPCWRCCVPHRCSSPRHTDSQWSRDPTAVLLDQLLSIPSSCCSI